MGRPNPGTWRGRTCRRCGGAFDATPRRGRPPVQCPACMAISPRPDVLGLYRQRDWDAPALGLGQAFDTELAERIGCSVTSVCDARKRRGIAPYRESRTCACGATYLARERDQRWCSARCSTVYGGALHHGAPEGVALVRVALSALHRDMYGDGRIGRSDWSKR